MKPTITKKVGFLLFLLTSGAMIAAGSFYSFIVRTAADGPWLDVSGRQRMLAQQIFAYANTVQNGNDGDRGPLREAMAAFNQSLRALEDGGRVMAYHLPPAPPEVRDEIGEAKRVWRNIEPRLALIADRPVDAPGMREAYNYVYANIGALTETSDRVVAAFQARTVARRHLVLYTLLAIAGLDLLLLLAGLWLTKRYLVRPVLQVEEAARRVRAGDFSYRLPTVTRDELSTLANTFNEMSANVDRLLTLVDTERRYNEEIVAGVPSGLLVLSADLRVLSANRSFSEMFGLAENDLLGQPLEAALPAGGLRAWAAEVLATGQPQRNILFDLADGEGKRFLRVNMTGIRRAAEHQEETRVLVAVEDLTEVDRLRTDALESERRFHDLAETALVGIIMTDARGLITYFNRAAERMFGYARDEVMDGPLKSLVPSLDDRLGSWEAEGLRQDGERIPIEGSTTRIGGRTGPFYTHVLRDLTERKRFETQLMYVASHDFLTGLFNRRRFEEELERRIGESQRDGTGWALLLIDLDEFKHVNDTLGHHAGDAVLIGLGEKLREHVRNGDVLARLGGDEFAVLMPRTDRAEAQAVAEGILKTLRRHTTMIDGQPVGVTASIGIAMFPEHGTTADKLFARADLAMYQAKEKGRNNVSVYAHNEAEQVRIESRLSWEKRIREALEGELFTLYCQPILDLRTNRVSRYELLLRMRGNGNEIVAPGTFLGIAERSGLIHDIDRWVVRQAIRLIADHHRAGRDLCLEVNLSGKTLERGDLLPLIRRELAETAIDPASLVLEITETAAIADIHQAQRFIETLKSLGCRFAIDDFGVGFSSFSYLKYLPVNYLKIDGSFIRNLPNDRSDQHLVKAMVEVARGLGKQTIAEFVDNEETVALLREYGVDYAQGHYIGRPRPIRGMLRSTGYPST